MIFLDIMTLYREELLEHYKDPQNFGKIEDPDFVSKEHNPLCGDQQEWMVKLESAHGSGGQTENTKLQKIISDVKFTGDGCAISIASASMLSEHVKGKALREIQDMTHEDMAALIGTTVSPARMKCLMLGLNTVQKGIDS